MTTKKTFRPRQARQVEPNHPSRAITVGVERVLVLAARDPAFLEELAQAPQEVVQRCGLRLRSSEAAMLQALPQERLQAMVGALDVSPANVARRGFLRAVAGAAMAVGLSGTLGSCDSDTGNNEGDGYIEGGVADGVLADSPVPDFAPPDQEPPDVVMWPDRPVWPDMGSRPNKDKPTQYEGGTPFGCETDADCFGEKCCETPWGVKLCTPGCEDKK